jgi:hypothetical protein
MGAAAMDSVGMAAETGIAASGFVGSESRMLILTEGLSLSLSNGLGYGVAPFQAQDDPLSYIELENGFVAVPFQSDSLNGWTGGGFLPEEQLFLMKIGMKHSRS